MHYLTAQWLLPITASPVKNGYLAIENGRILDVGRISDLPEGAELSSPVPGTFITPGLVNAHAHLEQSWPTAIPLVAGETFPKWLWRVTQSNRAFNSAAERAARAAAGAEELLETGTTCVNDIASGPESLHMLDKKGLRGIVSLECFHPDSDHIDISHIALSYSRFREGYERHPLLKTGLSPHSPYNFSPAAWKAVLDTCKPPVIHTHLAECEDEVRYLQGEPSNLPELHRLILGRVFRPQDAADSPVAYLARYGLLTDSTIAAHVVHTNLKDRDMLAKSGVAVVHCPRSNLALHGRTLQWPDWQVNSASFALGTDGRLSTENLDLRAEARCAMRLHGWHAAEALNMLTLGGARVMRMEAEIGSLEPGKWADVVLWQADSQRLETPEENVMAESTSVRQVWVAGQSCWEAAC